MSTYFLTGATGAVGSAVVSVLLDEPDTEVRLLLRADSEAGLASRLQALVRFCGWPDASDKLARLKAYRGDAALPRFGLQDAQYAELVGECSHVLHCAGTVRMNLPLEDARRSAVGSAHQVLGLARDLAAVGRLRKVEFVSTLGVAGKRPGVLPETWLDEAPAFHNTYEQAKFEAEAVVRAPSPRKACRSRCIARAWSSATPATGASSISRSSITSANSCLGARPWACFRTSAKCVSTSSR